MRVKPSGRAISSINELNLAPLLSGTLVVNDRLVYQDSLLLELLVAADALLKALDSDLPFGEVSYIDCGELFSSLSLEESKTQKLV